MRNFLRLFVLLFIAAVLSGCGSLLFGQVYSYLDENGVRVLTNIPPSTTVRDLKVNGAPPPPPQPVTRKPKVSPASQNRNGTASLTKAPVQNPNNKTAVRAAAAQPTQNPSDYDSIIAKYAGDYGVDPKLIHSMIATESGFNAAAVSPKGAQGLMQLMPETASRLGVRNPFDPEENISGGIKYMRNLLDTFAGYPDPLLLSLAAYNAGENLVQRLGRMPAIRETNEYVSSIIQRYGKRQTEVKDPATVEPPPRIYFFYENGVPVLTNIPPVIRSGNIVQYINPNSSFR